MDTIDLKECYGRETNVFVCDVRGNADSFILEWCGGVMNGRYRDGMRMCNAGMCGNTVVMIYVLVMWRNVNSAISEW